MRITLNLASRPYANLGPALRRLRIAIAALAVLCLLFFLGLHLFDRQAEAARALEHSLDGRIARVQTERSAAVTLMRRPDNARVLTQAEALNKLFDEKAFSWTLAMEAMETVLPAGVQVTSIEPIRAPDGHIIVHVRVVGPRDKADELVANLEQSRRFLQPRITGENAESTNNPSQRQEPISISNRFDFDLLAEYNPPTLLEARTNAERAAARSIHHPDSTIPLGYPNPKHLRHAPSVPQGGDRPPYTGPSRGGPQ
jgi:type IV pilus assembly protein PilN